MFSRVSLSLSTVVLLSASTLHAIKFETLGYQSVSMGGAAVANSTGSIAAYNNPALLAKTPYSIEVSLGGGISTYDHGALASVTKLENSGFIDTLDKASQNVLSLTPEDQQNLIDGTGIIIDMNGNAVTIAPQGYLGAQVYGFGFGVFGSSDSAATAVVDQAHNQLYFDNNGVYLDLYGNPILQLQYEAQSIEYAINQGLTYMDVTGAALVEVPIAYGYNFETTLGNIMVGGALKYMQAITYTDQYKIDNSGQINNGTDVKKDKQSSNVGMDLGIAYQPSFSYDLTLGLVGKNLNSPKFEFYDGTQYTIDPMVRAGLAYNIFESLQIAADIDLTSNTLLTEGVESQMVGGGINYEPFTSLFALSLRGGLMQNLHSGDNAGLIYTAGLGIGLKWFQIDLSGQMSSNSNTVDGTTVPEYTKVNLALVSRW